MTADAELLPLPRYPADGAEDEYSYNTGWNDCLAECRANVAHATAARDAEVEALRAEVEMLRDAFSDDDMTAGAHWFGRYVEQKRHAERLAEALRRVVKSFPDESVLLDAGWDGAEVDEACEAYDAARAALEQENDDA